jgi:hypothetical protein
MKEGKHIHSNDYKKQPAWFKGLNTLWAATYPLGSRSVLEKESLLKAARKATGLDDFGNDFWEEPLDRMLDSINKEANLHPIGRFITRQRIINLLAVRLRAEYYFKKHPEILEQEVYPTMMIVGLQRTGTTKLQRLLAADPDNRAVLSWEALNPAPIKNDIFDGKERIKLAKLSVNALRYMSPSFFAIHPIESESPEEDVLLLDVSFMSTTAEATMHVPSYSKWLEETDQSAAYAYMIKLLKLLQWQRPAKRWVLKTPHHMEFLALASKHFKDIHFIWTHRNVYDSIPSFLSMVAYSRALFSNEVNAEQVAEHWVRKTGFMLDKGLEFRNNGNKHIITDVDYKELIKDALAVVRKIYANQGDRVTPELEDTFQNANAENPQGKYGKHVYLLSDFGIDDRYLDEFTVNYQKFQSSNYE